MTKNERGHGTRTTLAVAIGAGVIGLAFLLVELRSFPTTRQPDIPYVRTFAGARNPLRQALAKGDGQAYAAVATDPSLQRPAVFALGAQDLSYRAVRPLGAYAAWLLSLGQPGLVPWALAALSLAGLMGASAASAVLGRRQGRSSLSGLVVAVLPPVLVAVLGLTPETVALALALSALVVNQSRPDEVGWTAVLLTAATLTRETMVLMALALAGERLWTLRHQPRRAMTQSAMLGAPPVMAVLGWSVFLRTRTGYWPWGNSSRRLGMPLHGLLEALPHWRSDPANWAVLAMLVGAAALVSARGNRQSRVVVVGFAGLALLLGPDVWARWQDFSRPLAPILALGLVVVAPALPARSAGPDLLARPPTGDTA